MKSILTVLGEDKVGIIAEVSALLAKNNINILDVSQTIMQGNFVMMMAINVPTGMNNRELNEAFSSLGKKLGVEITVRNAKIYDAMHNLD
ncbi:ACT domain-containing protein [Limosilactobacillus caecicola]|uniref:ACT domain-containing protein n=1 Tax=Limosilactobacillus caecicola TaxID=2941332 RepID=UPI00203F8DA2|nr:ACT domain-containing protein [Limosilactobacillus caecicola]